MNVSGMLSMPAETGGTSDLPLVNALKEVEGGFRDRLRVVDTWLRNGGGGYEVVLVGRCRAGDDLRRSRPVHRTVVGIVHDGALRETWWLVVVKRLLVLVAGDIVRDLAFALALAIRQP